jgi:glutathione S-transferase
MRRSRPIFCDALAACAPYDARMLTLHGFPMSPNTRRALLMLAECDAPHELVTVDLMAAEHRGDAYLALNASGRVPTLVDGDLVLWESNAILGYLAEKFADKHLGGETAADRAEIARWMFMNAAHLSPSLARVFAHTIRLPEDQRLPRIVEEARTDIGRSLRALERRLTGREHLGERFSIAEVSIAPSLTIAPMLGVDLATYPSVASWMDRIAARAAWKKVYG